MRVYWVWVGVCSACVINFLFSRKVEREDWVQKRTTNEGKVGVGLRIRNWSHTHPIHLRFAHRVSIWLTSVINLLLSVELSKLPFSRHKLSALVKHDSFVAHCVLLIMKVNTHARTRPRRTALASLRHRLRNATYALSPTDPRPDLAFMHCVVIVHVFLYLFTLLLLRLLCDYYQCCPCRCYFGVYYHCNS